MKLYELADEIRQAADAMAQEGVPENAIFDTIEAMAGSFNDKVIIIAKLLQESSARRAAIFTVRKSMQDRENAEAGVTDRLNNYLLRCMISTGIDRVESPEISIAIVKNNPSANITDEGSIPNKYWVPAEVLPARVDKVTLLHDLKLGPISGAELSQSKRLKIK